MHPAAALPSSLKWEERKKLFSTWEELRKTRLVTYLTLTDRPNLGLIHMVNDDAIRPLSSLLQKIGKTDRIDLMIYTRGGSMNAAHSLVKMFRQYAKEFNVIVPFRALSAGTQISLGADHILMSAMGQLSPVDPSTTNQFNPVLNPLGNLADLNNRKPISVEDVQSYLNLTKERVGLVSESHRLEVFKELTKNVEPLALGNVNRVYEEAQIIARDLLSMHMDPKTNSENIETIVKKLTQTYTHFFLLLRDEAMKVGLKVVLPTVTEEDIIMKIFASYEGDMRLNVPFDPDAILGAPALQTIDRTVTTGTVGIPATVPHEFKLNMGMIESSDDSYTCVNEGIVYPPLAHYVPTLLGQPGTYPPQPGVRIKFESWRSYNQISGSFV